MVDTVDRLAPELVEDAPVAVETVLLDFAREHDPETLVRFAHDLRNRLDQDGQYSDLDRRHRRRELTLHRRADGSASVNGELTAEAAEYLHTLFDTLAKPAARRATANVTRAHPGSGATTPCSRR